MDFLQFDLYNKFFLTCADFFFRHNNPKIGIRIFSNLVELHQSDPVYRNRLALQQFYHGFPDEAEWTLKGVIHALSNRVETAKMSRFLLAFMLKDTRPQEALELFRNPDLFIPETHLYQCIEQGHISQTCKLGEPKQPFEADLRVVVLCYPLTGDYMISLKTETEANQNKQEAMPSDSPMLNGNPRFLDFLIKRAKEDYVLSFVPAAKQTSPTTAFIEITRNFGRKNETKEIKTISLDPSGPIDLPVPIQKTEQIPVK